MLSFDCWMMGDKEGGPPKLIYFHLHPEKTSKKQGIITEEAFKRFTFYCWMGGYKEGRPAKLIYI